MRNRSRRSFLLTTVAAAGLALQPRKSWDVGVVDAVGATPSIRHNVATSEGKAMLKIYAEAVGKMMTLTDKDPGDPFSWIFQWYTHGVKQPWQQPISQTFKQQEISRIYTNISDPRRALAVTMWDTCTHYGQSEAYFLPWHRMYVYFFEQIVRAVSGENSFTLPYWDYTDVSAHALPGEFWMPADPVFKYLYRPQRGAGVNTGQPIDGGGPNTFLNLQDMTFPTYLKPAGGVGGFCPNLDRNLHGNVHTHVGAQPPASDLGMTFVPTAANDPIFWLHHCNIDRIWASWNKAGGANPGDATFLGQPFTFVDAAGHAIERKVGEVVDTQQLNYIYDQYLNRPPGSSPFPHGTPQPNQFTLFVHANSASTSGPISLTAQPTSVTLAGQSIPGLPSPGDSNDFSIQLDSVLDTRQIYLSLNDITAKQEPGVVYDVYLDVAPAAKLDRSETGYVGTLNFFGAVAHDDHTHAVGDAQSVALLVTDTVKKLRQAGRFSSVPTVTLVPQGSLVVAAEPKIGTIALVSQ